MNKQQFKLAMGLSDAQAERWYQPIEEAMMEVGIANPVDVASFLASCGHESASFHFLVELWQPTAIQANYKNRADLGNTKPEAIQYARAAGFDDVGRFYRGYGAIQVTGYNNLAAAGDALGLDLRRHPELAAATPRNAARVSAWWWQHNGASAVAINQGFLAVSRLVNRGNANSDKAPLGWDDRLARYNRAIKVLE